MNDINKTLYIPLYGKALVSKKGIILRDEKAEVICNQVQFPLKRKSKSKWLAYYMGMRAAVFDNWAKEKINEYPNAVVLHLGCGLDSRVERIAANSIWYDVDYVSVIEERKRYYTATESYNMISADIKTGAFIEELPSVQRAIVILEGVSMYLTNEELKNVLSKLSEHFIKVCVLLDCYTPFAAKMSKIKNPIKDVGVSKVYGIKTPRVLIGNAGYSFIKEREITPRYLVDELKGKEKFIFKNLYAGKISKSLYKLYEYEI